MQQRWDYSTFFLPIISHPSERTQKLMFGWCVHSSSALLSFCRFSGPTTLVSGCLISHPVRLFCGHIKYSRESNTAIWLQKSSLRSQKMKKAPTLSLARHHEHTHDGSCGWFFFFFFLSAVISERKKTQFLRRQFRSYEMTQLNEARLRPFSTKQQIHHHPSSPSAALLTLWFLASLPPPGENGDVESKS